MATIPPRFKLLRDFSAIVAIKILQKLPSVHEHPDFCALTALHSVLIGSVWRETPFHEKPGAAVHKQLKGALPSGNFGTAGSVSRNAVLQSFGPQRMCRLRAVGRQTGSDPFVTDNFRIDRNPGTIVEPSQMATLDE
ncbi:hypothetical protein [Edaphobacter modestus]|uniref:hypothetical protein n=1 Tax=Edaphobacter modestus TaxID=388466 RepID=UPI0013EED174|nr:hypothetical protein [Edaphobacter modestus]